MTIRLHPKKIPLYAAMITLTLLWLLPVVSAMLKAAGISRNGTVANMDSRKKSGPACRARPKAP